MNKKIIIFGGAGFIGSHVADELTKRNCDVTIFDIKKSEYLLNDQKMIVGDILNKKEVSNAIQNKDFVLNFAGIADIDNCLEKPIEAVKYNILGNTIILEMCVQHNIQKYIFASSAYVYSKLGAIYKNTKQSCELLIETYNKLKNLNYIILRFGSLYGPRSNENNSIYRIIKNALINKKIKYNGTGNEIRQFIHVRDAAKLTAETIFTNKYDNKNLILTGQTSLEYKRLLDMIDEMLEYNIDITYHNKESDTHYITTPYYFSPKIGTKITSNEHVDLGQGLLELMEIIYNNIK